MRYGTVATQPQALKQGLIAWLRWRMRSSELIGRASKLCPITRRLHGVLQVKSSHGTQGHKQHKKLKNARSRRSWETRIVRAPHAHCLLMISVAVRTNDNVFCFTSSPSGLVWYYGFFTFLFCSTLPCFFRACARS